MTKPKPGKPDLNEFACQAPAATDPVYYNLFKNLPTPAFLWQVCGDDFVLVALNEAATQSVGGPVDQLVGKTAGELFHDRPDQPAVLAECLRTQTIQRCETQISLRLGGELRDVSVTCVPLTQELALAQVEDVTTRKQDERQIQESEERFSAIFHSSHDAISIARLADDVYLDVNEAFCNVFGVMREQVIGYTGLELNIAGNPALREELLHQLRCQGQATNFEAQFRNHLGQTGFLLISGRIVKIYDQDCLVIFGKDITLRKQAEAALQIAHDELEQRVTERTAELNLSLERLDLATDAAQMGTWDWDVQKDELHWDKQMCALYGIRPEDFRGNIEAWLHCIHPDDRETSKQVAQQALYGGQGYDTEFRVLWPDGSIHWLKANAEAFWDAQGAPLRMVGVDYDITARKQAEEELRLFKTIIETSSEAIAISDSDGNLVYINTAHEKLFGRKLEQAQKIPYRDFYPLKSVEALNTIVSPALERGESWEGELEAFNAAGELFSLWERADTIRKPDGSMLYAFGLMHDITARKQAEQKLAETNLALEKALRAKDEFMAAMGHELRTPLTSILGLAETLQLPHYGELSDKQRKAVGNIEKSGRRLLEVINDVLEFTKLQSGAEALQLRDCEMESLCQAAVRTVSAQVAKRQQHIHFAMHPGQLTLRTDEGSLKKALAHLLNNASKFTPEDGELGLEVRGDAQAQQVTLTVWDKGIGIKTQDFPRLFQPFVQLDASLARQYEGTGLGLALVKLLVEPLGGSLSLESVHGQGSRFTITLPWAG